MVGLQEAGKETGFTLANANTAGLTDAPAIADRHDSYHYGWGIRREGDGTIPPAMIPADNPPQNSRQTQLLYNRWLK